MFNQKTIFSDSIATSDVYPSEDLEYIVQAQRNPDSASYYRCLQFNNPPFIKNVKLFIHSLDEPNDVNSMGTGPFLTDETDFLFASFERKCSFSSNVTAYSFGSRDSFGRAKKRPTLVINSKLSSQLCLKHER